MRKILIKKLGTNKQEYCGVVGTPTPLKDSLGKALYVGDLCFLYNKDGTVSDLQFVTEYNGDFIVMGLADTTRNGKDYSNEWTIIKHKYFNFIKPLEEHNSITMVEVYDLSLAEKMILTSLPQEFKYITRDWDGILSVHCQKPIKDTKCWYNEDGGRVDSLPSFSHLFNFIEFDIEEPFLIENLIREVE